MMKKSSKVILLFLSSIAISSCGKTHQPINKKGDWTVQSSTNNDDSVRYYQQRTGRHYFYPFIWHNSYRQNFTRSGNYAPSYFSKKGGFTVGNRSVTRGGFGSSTKVGS